MTDERRRRVGVNHVGANVVRGRRSVVALGTVPPMLLVLTVYLALIVLASLGGGWFTARMRLTHTRMQLIMSFVAGLMLGVCFLHMVPHSIHATHSADLSMIWLVAGLLTTFFLIRAFQFHQHVDVNLVRRNRLAGVAHALIGIDEQTTERFVDGERLLQQVARLGVPSPLRLEAPEKREHRGFLIARADLPRSIERLVVGRRCLRGIAKCRVDAGERGQPGSAGAAPL